MLTRRHLLRAIMGAPLLGALPARAQGGRRVGGAGIAVEDGRLWMPVHLGGRGPFPFIIDTGSFTNLIRSDLARQLDLDLSGRMTIFGLGGEDIMPLVRVSPVLLGQVDIGLSEFAAYDAADLRIHERANGALSSLILTTVDADLDFDRNEWRVYPDGRESLAGYEPIPSRIELQERGRGSPKIRVDVEIDGRRVRLEVDSGAPDQIILWGGALGRSRLWNDAVPYVPTQLAGIGGVGGRGRLVRAREARIGGIRFERPLVELVRGGPRDPNIDGLLGIELLRQMNIATDVRARRVFARRNAQPAPAERYGMSGMWIDERGERLLVADVSPLSPAAEAGLRVGDEIVGTPFGRLIDRLSGAPGDVIDISYRRGGEERTARVTLRPYI